MRANSTTSQGSSVRRFSLGQTFITPGAEEALLIAGETEIEFLRRHMSCDWGELSEDDILENELSLKEGFRLLSAYRTAKGQKLYVMWNKGSDLLSKRSWLGFWFGRFSYYLSSVGVVGTVGNSTFFVEFSKRCGNGGKTRFVFPRFPQRGSFHSPFFSAADLFPRSHTL